MNLLLDLVTMQKKKLALYANQLMLFMCHEESFAHTLLLSLLRTFAGMEFISFGPYTNKMIKRIFASHCGHTSLTRVIPFIYSVCCKWMIVVILQLPHALYVGIKTIWQCAPELNRILNLLEYTHLYTLSLSLLRARACDALLPKLN